MPPVGAAQVIRLNAIGRGNSVEFVRNGDAEHGFAPLRLASNGALFLIGSLFGNGLNYLFGLYFARTLGAADFGLLTLALTVFNIVVLFAPLGMTTAAVRFVSQGNVGGHSARHAVIGCAAIAGVMGIVFALILELSAGWIAQRMFDKPELAPVLRLLALAVAPVALGGVLMASLQALGRVSSLVFIRHGIEPIGKLVFAAVAVALGWGVFGVAGALLSTYLLSLALSVVCLRRVPALRGQAKSGPTPWAAMLGFSL